MTVVAPAAGAPPVPPTPRLAFELPPELEAREPPEARGLARDEVRLLVTRATGDRVEHARFRDLPSFLRAGDLLVVNTSATLPAALDACRPGGEPLRLHLSTRLPAGLWTVELRRPEGAATGPFRDGRRGETLELPGGARAVLLAPRDGEPAAAPRLWVARLELPREPLEYLAAHGRPIRYGYVPRDWPLESYQTVFATEPGSAEMPSAGRAFTPELVTRLVAGGVAMAPLWLHTGVASLEEHEPPYPEEFRVPEATARQVNLARAMGGRVIAVGTTVVRALETAADERGTLHPATGWTGLLVTPERGVRAVDALVTGLHEPRASHLMMLEAIAGRDQLDRAYRAALEERYLWHEFGDLHLILP